MSASPAPIWRRRWRTGSRAGRSMSTAAPTSLRDPAAGDAAQGCVAVLNAGSSSIKFAVYDPAAGLAVLFRGQIEGIGVKPHLKIADAQGRVAAERTWPAERLDHEAATRELLT